MWLKYEAFLPIDLSDTRFTGRVNKNRYLVIYRFDRETFRTKYIVFKGAFNERTNAFSILWVLYFLIFSEIPSRRVSENSRAKEMCNFNYRRFVDKITIIFDTIKSRLLRVCWELFFYKRTIGNNDRKIPAWKEQIALIKRDSEARCSFLDEFLHSDSSRNSTDTRDGRL